MPINSDSRTVTTLRRMTSREVKYSVYFFCAITSVCLSVTVLIYALALLLDPNDNQSADAIITTLPVYNIPKMSESDPVPNQTVSVVKPPPYIAAIPVRAPEGGINVQIRAEFPFRAYDLKDKDGNGFNTIFVRFKPKKQLAPVFILISVGVSITPDLSGDFLDSELIVDGGDNIKLNRYFLECNINNGMLKFSLFPLLQNPDQPTESTPYYNNNGAISSLLGSRVLIRWYLPDLTSSYKYTKEDFLDYDAYLMAWSYENTMVFMNNNENAYLMQWFDYQKFTTPSLFHLNQNVFSTSYYDYLTNPDLVGDAYKTLVNPSSTGDKVELAINDVRTYNIFDTFGHVFHDLDHIMDGVDPMSLYELVRLFNVGNQNEFTTLMERYPTIKRFVDLVIPNSSLSTGNSSVSVLANKLSDLTTKVDTLTAQFDALNKKVAALQVGINTITPQKPINPIIPVVPTVPVDIVRPIIVTPTPSKPISGEIDISGTNITKPDTGNSSNTNIDASHMISIQTSEGLHRFTPLIGLNQYANSNIYWSSTFARVPFPWKANIIDPAIMVLSDNRSFYISPITNLELPKVNSYRLWFLDMRNGVSQNLSECEMNEKIISFPLGSPNRDIVRELYKHHKMMFDESIVLWNGQGKVIYVSPSDPVSIENRLRKCYSSLESVGVFCVSGGSIAF